MRTEHQLRLGFGSDVHDYETTPRTHRVGRKEKNIVFDILLFDTAHTLPHAHFRNHAKTAWLQGIARSDNR
jgi:hypothetical protein